MRHSARLPACGRAERRHVVAFGGCHADQAGFHDDHHTLGSPFALSFHLHVLTVAHWLAPFQNARLGLGVATAYLFLQGVHYSAWVSWIPQQEQPGRGTFTFRMTARSLFADFGAPGVAAVALARARC
jgi:hypothetical protein